LFDAQVIFSIVVKRHVMLIFLSVNQFNLLFLFNLFVTF